jgi:hypothetical protein
MMAGILVSGVLLTAGGEGAKAGLGPGEPLPLLVHSAAVQKELGVTDKQLVAARDLYEEAKKKALPKDELAKGLADALDAAQCRRLKEISRQARGGQALLDEDVAGDLGLSPRERDDLTRIWQEEDHKLQEALSRLNFKTEAGRREYIAKRRQATTERMLGALNARQREGFEKLKGKEFDRRNLPEE